MTPKQTEYVRHRAIGLGQARSAIKAGYAESSAKVIASRMEKLPAIRAAIDEARDATKGRQSDATEPKFADAEAYLTAVVQGLAPADPMRISAARTLIAYQRAKQRVPVKSATPTQLNKRETGDEERDLLEKWAEKAAAVRARLSKT